MEHENFQLNGCGWLSTCNANPHRDHNWKYGIRACVIFFGAHGTYKPTAEFNATNPPNLLRMRTKWKCDGRKLCNKWIVALRWSHQRIRFTVFFFIVIMIDRAGVGTLKCMLCLCSVCVLSMTVFNHTKSSSILKWLMKWKERRKEESHRRHKS